MHERDSRAIEIINIALLGRSDRLTIHQMSFYSVLLYPCVCALKQTNKLYGIEEDPWLIQLQAGVELSLLLLLLQLEMVVEQYERQRERGKEKETERGERETERRKSSFSRVDREREKED